MKFYVLNKNITLEVIFIIKKSEATCWLTSTELQLYGRLTTDHIHVFFLTAVKQNKKLRSLQSAGTEPEKRGTHMQTLPQILSWWEKNTLKLFQPSCHET